MADKYNSFVELAAHETVGIDYRLRVHTTKSTAVIIAPHGGEIEPGTSQIAEAIAGDEFSFYCFEGIKRDRPHGDLHITSAKFDEPEGCRLVANAEVVIAIHGRHDRDDRWNIWAGGMNSALRDRIVAGLANGGFPAVARKPGESLAGATPANICNRGKTKGGVQLEIPRTLRDAFRVHAPRLEAFANAMRSSIHSYIAETG